MTAGTGLSVAERLQRAVVVGISRLPQPLLRRLAHAPVNADGDTMAPEIALLMAVAEKGEDYSDLDPAAARTVTDAEARLFADRLPACAVEEELDLPGGTQATRYSAGGAGRGLVLFLHGGGFVLGNRASYEGPVRRLARGAQADVLSVEYRLAPEHPFPAPHEDALAAWEYAVEQAPAWGIDPRRIVVAGDSAGAAVAAVLCQALAGREVQPLLQVLIYPPTDLATSWPSHEEFGSCPALTAKQLDWFKGHYLPTGTDLRDPRVSPLYGALEGLPPAVISVAGFDSLRDEGLEYAARLRDSGVPVRMLREGGLVHGFLSYSAISPASRVATDRIAAAIDQVLATAGSTSRVVP